MNITKNQYIFYFQGSTEQKSWIFLKNKGLMDGGRFKDLVSKTIRSIILDVLEIFFFCRFRFKDQRRTDQKSFIFFTSRQIEIAVIRPKLEIFFQRFLQTNNREILRQNF